MINLKAQVFFAKRLAFLMEADVPLLEALTMLKGQVGSKSQAEFLARVMDDIARGQSLSKSLGKFPELFGASGIAIISIGEASGTLRENLAYLGEELEKREAARGKILAALLYPAVVLCGALGIIAFLLLYLFPKITPIFLSLGRQLPLTTRIVIALSRFISEWGIALCIFSVLITIAGAIVIKRSVKAQRTLDRIVLHVPLIGLLKQRHLLTHIMRTLSVLLQSGVALPDALSLAADTAGSFTYTEKLRACAEWMRKGGRISEAFENQERFFPKVCAQMAAVGERSGNLAGSLAYLSALYEREAEESFKRISVALEPALMITMGFMVGFIAISIITPIYGITQNLHP